MLFQFCYSHRISLIDLIDALVSASPPMSMRDILGIKDPAKDSDDAKQKQREKTAYVPKYEILSRTN
jgi:hypothetical protein